MSINKQVRKKILETKEQKEKLLIEQKLVHNRIMMIVEDMDNIKNFKSLSEEKQLKLSFNLLREFSYLESNGILNEQLSDFLGKIFGNSLGGITQTLVEPMINSLLSSLGMGGYWKNFVISFVTSQPSRIVKAFGDCRELTGLMAEALTEATFMSMQQSRGMGGFGYDLIRNTLGGAIKDTAFMKGIESGIEDIVCNLFSKFTDNAKEVVTKLEGTPVTG